MSLYSEEIQDIMERIPGRIFRIGLTVIFCIMLMFLVGSYFFRYPEIISCPVILTTINPPQELYAQSAGKIEVLNVKEQEAVESGHLIAILQNTADYQDAFKLGRKLKGWEKRIIWDSIVTQELFPLEMALGELQSAYLRMYKAWSNFQTYLKQNYLPLKIDFQKEQIEKQKINLIELCRQQKILQYGFELTKKQYSRDSAFFCRFKDAISMVEYEKQTQEYLQKQSIYMSFCGSIRSAEYNILKQNEIIIDLQIEYENELASYRQELDEAYQLLYENYKQWKEKYILISDIRGLVTFTGYWSKNQIVNFGDRIATIVPQEKTQIIGRAIVGMSGIGKVEKGQEVNIKLTGFPYIEFGILKGYVNHVSLVPEKGKGYIAEIVLSGGMQSSYQKSLKFIQNIEGIAEIVTKDQSLFQKLISPLRFKVKE